MPHVSLILYPGRSKSELKEISCNIQKCLVETTGCKPNDISVSVEEIESTKFVMKVNKKTENEEIVIPSDFIK